MRYLFCSLASYGLIGPAIKIAQAVRQHGHTVAFVTDLSMSGVLQQAGIERIPRGVQDGKSFQVEFAGHPLDIARQVKHVEYALQQFSADILVTHQLALGPLIAGRRHKLPVAVIGLAAYIWPTESSLAHAWGTSAIEEHVQDYRTYLVKRYERFIQAYNLGCEMFLLPQSRPPYGETPLTGDLFLLRSVPELERVVQGLPSHVHFVGDCSWDFPAVSDESELSNWLAAAIRSGEPLIYVQPGRGFNTPSFWDHLVAALGDQPIRVAASVGRMDHPLTTIPRNFFVRDHVPMERVLPHARGVISSSTSTTVLGALTHGLPLLLIPGGGGGEQLDLVLRCLEAQVAIDFSPYRLTAEMLGQKVALLLGDATLQRAAQRLKDAFATVNGCGRAADLLIALGHQTRSADPRSSSKPG